MIQNNRIERKINSLDKQIEKCNPKALLKINSLKSLSERLSNRLLADGMPKGRRSALQKSKYNK